METHKGLIYNDPNRAKERQEAKAPTHEEIIEAVDIFNKLIKFTDKYKSVQLFREEIALLQSILDHYQNLQHFYDVAGGWGGLERLKSAITITAPTEIKAGTTMRILPAKTERDIEVNYEFVKDVNG